MIPRFPTHAFFACLLVLLLGAESIAQPPGGRRGRRGPRQSRILQILDADKDGTLSKKELAGARATLLTLDEDGDGNLTKEEMAPKEGNRGRRRMWGGMRGMDPVMDAADKDSDGELFDDEVIEIAESLLTLDKNQDGAVSAEEMRPSFRGFGGGPGRRGGFGRDGGERPEKTPLPAELKIKDGSDSIKDRAMFRTLSYQGKEVMIDTHLAGLEFVKFQIEGAGTDNPHLYFLNTNTHRSHPGFMRAMGMARRGEGRMRGVLTYWPMLEAPNGATGLYTFEYEPNDSYGFEMIKISYDLLVKFAPILEGKLAYNLLPRSKEKYVTEPEKYKKAKLPTWEVADRYKNVSFLPLNNGESFGKLTMMKADERPDPQAIVIYTTLPNEMPRVAGVITGVRQTPLSHVNLRAIQDNIPNAFIGNVAQDKEIAQLVGKYVFYKVAADGFELRVATKKEVSAHFKKLRPAKAQKPPRNLKVREVRAFADISFDDGDVFGVKASNLATLSKLGLPEGTTPQGYAVPFSFYDAFMKHNGFYEMAARMTKTADFQTNADTREKSLKKFRKAIKKGKLPGWMKDALGKVQERFGKGVSIRCRSSTNNEDLPGFSGAGLYDSFTHHPDEGHLQKSIRQVYASLWNFRAYEERAFYRIEHMTTAMGVVLHRNTEGELANGVAVTRDILYQTEGQTGVRFYVNAQKGEDLVTNPNATSIPEELLLSPRNPRTDRVVRRSSSVKPDEKVVADKHLWSLRRALRRIHAEFHDRYGKSEDDPFAMEIEFKVTSDDKLFIKQARPWVFKNAPLSEQK